jgi:serine/threonine protein kinase
MAHAPKPNRNPSAALFNRSVSYQQPGTPVESDSEDNDSTSPPLSSTSEAFQTVDVRRAKSLRTAGQYGGSTSRLLPTRTESVGLSSFGAAGSTLTSPALSSIGEYTPPAAARHALFAHHVNRPGLGLPRSSSPSVLSEPGVIPPSPTESTRSGGFSPASAFLSHFSSSNSLKPQTTIAPDALGAKVLSYTLGKLIGRGGFSAVREAIHENGEVLACKIVKKDDLSDQSGSLERFEEEIKIWQSLPRHPSFLPLVEMHRTSSMTFLLTPLLSGGSLLDVLKREHGSENTARKWFPGVVAAVSALHEGFDDWSGHVLHGDLKLDNFLVDLHGHVVVCDFYMCRKLDDGKPLYTSPATIPLPLTPGRGRKSRTSSPYRPIHRHTESEISDPALAAAPYPSASMPYASPELLRPPRREPSLSQDVWAVGCILYALLTGRLPFVDSYDPRLQMKILNGHWEHPIGIGREWIECLSGCLDTNMDTRWDIKRVRESDAVVGWREVKGRSKSRSRSRMRGGARDQSRGPRDQSRGPSTSRGPPSSDRFRGRKDSLLSNAPSTQPMSIRRPQSKEHLSPYMQPGHGSHDSFGVQLDNPASGSQSRSNGNDNGRSRSSSRKPLSQQDLSTSMDYMNINRGRSMAKKGEMEVCNPSQSPVGSWRWNQNRDQSQGSGNPSRDQSQGAGNRRRDQSQGGNRSRSRDIIMTQPPRTASASTSRPRNNPINAIAVPHSAPLPPTLSTSTAYPDDSPTRSHSRGRARYSDKVADRLGHSADSTSSSGTPSSPVISRRSTSQSQSRNSPDRGWRGNNSLGIVEEDKALTERDHVEEYRGRSISRGR